MKSKKVLVLGASGYLGSRLKHELFKNDYVTFGLGRDDTNDFKIDLRSADTDSLSEIFNQFDVVVGASWYVNHVDYMFSSENHIWQKIYNEIVLDALTKSGVQHFIGLGSCLEYGLDPASPITKNSPTVTDTLYAECKHRVFNKFTNQLRDAQFSWLRLFYVYGGNENPSKLIPSLRRTILRGESFDFRNPDIVNDYVHVDHVVQNIMRVLELSLSGLHNIGSGRPVRNGDLHSIISGNSYDPRPIKNSRGHYCSDVLMTDNNTQFRL